MRETIKELESEIADLREDKRHWYEKATTLEREKEKKQKDEMYLLSEEKNRLESQVANLLEIVRWHCNPRTAEAPFLPLKEQRDDRGGRNY